VANPYVVRNTATHSTAIGILQLTAPSNEIVEILRAWVTQETVTATGQAGVELRRTSTAGTGTTVTPASLSSGTSNATALHTLTGGTLSAVLYREGFNIVNGWLYLPVPEERITIPPGGFLQLAFTTAPASASYSYGMIYQELG
jgi:hypothetical protein